MGSDDVGQAAARVFLLPTLEEQVALVKRHGTDTLLFCHDPWALRHWFLNRETGEMVRARCNRWDCPYCGPRKVDRWRQLIALAEPTLFVTLTKVGWTLEEAARVYTTALQYVRRGSKGYGPNHVGARPAYPLECFSVLEEHRDFERVGFHWHLLAKGVEYLPKQVVSDALRSATKGRSYIVDVKSVKKVHAVGYVTKYLTKEITAEKRGMKEALQEMLVYRLDEEGHLIAESKTETAKVLSKARRIRYTRHFFPASTAELRLRLFTDLGETDQIAKDEQAVPDIDEPVEDVGGGALGQAVKSSPWILFEREAFSSEIEDYRARREAALYESVEALRSGKPMYSRRILGVWAYQRKRQAR
jgi:hypothetical protein